MCLASIPCHDTDCNGISYVFVRFRLNLNLFCIYVWIIVVFVFMYVLMAPGKIGFKLTGVPSLNKVFELNWIVCKLDFGIKNIWRVNVFVYTLCMFQIRCTMVARYIRWALISLSCKYNNTCKYMYTFAMS